MANTVKLWRYREKVVLGDPNGKVQTRPGRYVSKFVPKITLHGAPYRLSERYIASTQGTDFQNTIVLAVRHHPGIAIKLFIKESITRYHMLHQMKVIW